MTHTVGTFLQVSLFVGVLCIIYIKIQKGPIIFNVLRMDFGISKWKYFKMEVKNIVHNQTLCWKLVFSDMFLSRAFLRAAVSVLVAKSHMWKWSRHLKIFLTFKILQKCLQLKQDKLQNNRSLDLFVVGNVAVLCVCFMDWER